MRLAPTTVMALHCPNADVDSSTRSSSRHSRLHPDVQVEKHPRPEEPLELLSRRRADALDHVAALADHDRLLRLAIHDDRAVQPQQPARRLAGSSNRSTTTALENGISACVNCSSFSRTISAGEKPLRLIRQVVGGIAAARLPAAGRRSARSSRSTFSPVAADIGMISAKALELADTAR